MKRLARKPLICLLGLLLWQVPAGATGILLPRPPGIPPLAIKSHRVQVVITDQVANAHVEQVFVNHTSRPLEATFVFPLPAGASVSEFAMMMNGKRVTGEVLEKEKARRIYSDIVRRMRDPGLLEYLGNNLFKASVFPIPPHSDQKIELTYSQVLRPDAGLAEFVFPLKTGNKASRVLNDFTMSVEIRSRIPVKTVYSPTHQVDVSRKSDHLVRAGFEVTQALLDRDFRLIYTISQKDFGLNLLTHRRKGKPGTFLMMIAPKFDIKETDILPKDICFVIDTSGSMSGVKMDQARKALRYCVQSLNPKDRFNLVRFSTDVEPFRKSLQPAGKSAIREAGEFINRFNARGGTDINQALETALSMRQDSKRPFLVVFLTDGLPTIGTTDPKQIVENVRARNKAGTRIFVFGVGHQVNTHLLDKIAQNTRATSQYVAPEEDIEIKVSSFFDKVNAPVMASLRLDIPDIDPAEIYPRNLPDLFKGTQLLVLGRYRKSGHIAIKLTGEINGQQKSIIYEGSFPEAETASDYLPRLWANRKIGYLLDAIRLKGESRELVDEVIALGKEFGIVTPYTSFLIAEDEVRPQVGRAPRLRPGHPIPWSAPVGQKRDLRFSQSSAAQVKVNAGPSSVPSHATRRSRAADKALPKIESARKAAPMLLSATAGEQAVKTSQAIHKMKDSLVVEKDLDMEAKRLVRRIGDRTFHRGGDSWVDASWDGKPKPLEVKYLSQAYFQLLDKFPELKKVFALGQKVLVVLDSGRALKIGEQGLEALSPETVKSL